VVKQRMPTQRSTYEDRHKENDKERINEQAPASLFHSCLFLSANVMCDLTTPVEDCCGLCAAGSTAGPMCRLTSLQAHRNGHYTTKP